MTEEVETEEVEKTESLRETIEKAASSEAEVDSGVEEKEVERVEPPEHWSQLDKDRFSELPDEIKPLWLEKTKSLETGYNEKFERVADWEKQQARFNEIFSPLASELSLHGVQPMDMVQRLIGAHQFLRSDPEAGLRWIAEQYGAGHMLGGVEEDSGYLDPMAEKKIQQLEQQVQSLTQTLGGFQGNYQQTQQAQLQSQIRAFETAVDAEGKPKYPYFQNVREQMGQLFAAGAVSTLEEAYQKAIRLNDDVFGQVQKAEQDKAKKEAEAKRKAEAEKARKAADARVSSSGQSGGAPKYGNLRDAVKAAVQEQRA